MYYRFTRWKRQDLSRIAENAIANYLKILEILVIDGGDIDILKIQVLSTAVEG